MYFFVYHLHLTSFNLFISAFSSFLFFLSAHFCFILEMKLPQNKTQNIYRDFRWRQFEIHFDLNVLKKSALL